MNILDILYRKKQKCIYAGEFNSRWLIKCLKDKLSSKPHYCYKICEHFKQNEDTIIKNQQGPIMPMYGCPSSGFKPQINMTDSNCLNINL